MCRKGTRKKRNVQQRHPKGRQCRHELLWKRKVQVTETIVAAVAAKAHWNSHMA